MLRKFIVIFILILVCSLAYNNSFIPPTMASKEYDSTIQSYTEYYTAIKDAIIVRQSNLSIKVTNYNDKIYDFNRVMEDIIKNYPEIAYYYEGAQLRIIGNYLQPRVKIQDISFKYKSDGVIPRQLKTIQNYEQFYTAIENAFYSFDNQLSLKLNNYHQENYNLNQTINRVLENNPDLDYGYTGASAQISDTGSRRIMEIYFEYAFSKKQMMAMRKAVDQKAERVVTSLIKPDMIDYEKELALHNYLVNNAKYSQKFLRGSLNSKEESTPYGVLIKGVGGCSSYAKAMQKLLNMAGVKCIYVTGTAKGQPHAWNIVKVSGKYYHLDVTWDDPVTNTGKNVLRYDYFNLSDSQIEKDHQWDRNKYPRCNTKK